MRGFPKLHFFRILAHCDNTESERRLFNVWFEYPLGTFELDGTVNIYNIGNFIILMIILINHLCNFLK